jgi:hypothetical protein
MQGWLPLFSSVTTLRLIVRQKYRDMGASIQITSHYESLDVNQNGTQESLPLNRALPSSREDKARGFYSYSQRPIEQVGLVTALKT